jgi:uncharacterized membrane protein
VRLIAKYFLRGLLVVVPAAATIWILYTVFVFVDGLVRLPANEWRVPLVGWRVPGMPTDVPGLGILITVALITLAGVLASNYLMARFLSWSERLFTHLPGVKIVYSAIKDLIEAVLSEQKKFDKPVFLRIADEVEVIGFVTRDDMTELDLADSVAVYVPQSYNFAANLIIVPRHRVRPIQKPASEVMAFVVSGGVSSIGALE